MIKEEVIIEGDITWSRGGNIKVDGFPPSGWDDLSTEEQFAAIYDVVGQEIEIKTIQFKF